MFKTCSKCKVKKHISLFNKDKGTKSGLQSQCKQCKKMFNAKYHQTKEYKDKEREYRRTSSVYKERLRKYNASKLRTDIQYAIKKRLRSRLNQAYHGMINNKNVSAVSDLGCSIYYFKEYIQGLFKPGMDWENYGIGPGKWNFDHIIPLASFNLANREESIKAVHYTNLQPLWSIENSKKDSSPLTRTPSRFIMKS